MRTKLILILAALVFAIPSVAATYQVTSSSCSGVGSLNEAIQQANANPGDDIIEVAAGLIFSGRCGTPASSDGSQLQVTENLLIRGNSAIYVGENSYVSSSGAVDPIVSDCPTSSSFTGILGGIGVSLFMVGERAVDNSGVELTIENLTVSKVSQLAQVRDRAKLTLREVNAIDIRDVDTCRRPAIEAFGAADATLENVTFLRATNFEFDAPSALVLGNSGKLEVYNSMFDGAVGRYAIAWGGDADIVSSFFENSGGLWNYGTGNMRVINSLFLPTDGIVVERRYTDGFVSSGGGAIQLEASTILYSVIECKPFPSLSCVWRDGISTATFQALSGTIGFSESVLHVQTLDPVFTPSSTLLLETMSPGFFSADDMSFIQPLAWQDAAALRTITQQTALLTGPDSLPTTDDSLGGLAIGYPESVTPIVSGAATLVDKILDAGTGGTNELKDPRGAVISTDILGNSRVDSGLRSIGAVQNNVIPHLSVSGVAGDVFAVNLSWNEPVSSGISGYDICYGTGTPPDPTGLGSSCPATLVEGFSNSPETTKGRVDNLPPGSSNWFLVRAVAGSTKEPWSNVATRLTPVLVNYPSTPITAGGSISIAPSIIGSLIDPVYQVSSGTLPAGLMLNPSTGVISGIVPASECGTAVGLLAVDSRGVLATSTVIFKCAASAVPVPTLTGSWLLMSILLLVGVAWLGHRAKLRA